MFDYWTRRHVGLSVRFSVRGFVVWGALSRLLTSVQARAVTCVPGVLPLLARSRTPSPPSLSPLLSSLSPSGTVQNSILSQLGVHVQYQTKVFLFYGDK